MEKEITIYELEFSNNTNDFKLDYEEESTDIEVEFREVNQVNVTVAIHNELQDRDANNAHPIKSITNLQEELDSKVSKLDIESIPINSLIATDEKGNLVKGLAVNDTATKQYVSDNISKVVQDIKYTHVQLSSSSTWDIIHNLNKMPSVTVVDSAGTIVVGEINYINYNRLTIRFTSQFSGKAYLN